MFFIIKLVLINYVNDTIKHYWDNYFNHVGLYFIFTAFAGISIIV